MIYSSNYPPVKIPDRDIYTEILGTLSSDDFDRIAVTDGLSNLTYGELKLNVDAFAGALTAKGIKKGDVIAIQVPNSAAFVIAFFGILRIGAIVTTVNQMYSSSEVARQLKDSKAKAYITNAMSLSCALSASAEAGILKENIIVSDGSQGHISMSELLAQELPAPTVKFDPNTTLAVLPYSSGTTGLAKGVMLTHRNLMANIVQGGTVLNVSCDDKVMAVLPFYHIYGMNMIMNLTLYRRGTLTTLSKMDLPVFLDLIQSQKITYLYIAPPIAVALAKHPLVDEYDLSSVRLILSAAAPMDEALGKTLLNRLSIPIIQGFGMTELSPVSHIAPIGDDRISLGSVGTVLPNIEFKVIDIETGEEVPEAPGGRTRSGEMLIRGPNVMLGYLGNESATSHSITPDGWLRTGDIVEVGPYEEVYVVDRLKELIKYKGYQVPPAELEALLLGHPAISDVAVVGYPDEAAGEIPLAFIVLQKGENSTKDEIIEWVSQRIAPHKRIRMVEFIDIIPKSAAGKILRKDLKTTERPLQK